MLLFNAIDRCMLSSSLLVRRERAEVSDGSSDGSCRRQPGGADPAAVRAVPSCAAGGGLPPRGAGRGGGRAPVAFGVRPNQVAAGGWGGGREILKVLGEVTTRAPPPPLHSLGGIGTGDLTALASTALC